jgi:putative ATPase
MVEHELDNIPRHTGSVQRTTDDNRVENLIVMAQGPPAWSKAPTEVWLAQLPRKKTLIELLEERFEMIDPPFGTRLLFAPSQAPRRLDPQLHLFPVDIGTIAVKHLASHRLAKESRDQDMGNRLVDPRRGLPKMVGDANQHPLLPDTNGVVKPNKRIEDRFDVGDGLPAGHFSVGLSYKEMEIGLLCPPGARLLIHACHSLPLHPTPSLWFRSVLFPHDDDDREEEDPEYHSNVDPEKSRWRIRTSSREGGIWSLPHKARHEKGRRFAPLVRSSWYARAMGEIWREGSLFPEETGEERSEGASYRPATERSAKPAVQGSPLAERMRPQNLEEFIGQKHLLAPDRLLGRLIREDSFPSVIFWGPPGTGKTTLARIIARQTRSRFLPFSAVTAGIREIREVMREAAHWCDREGRRTVLFIDEIHRFNRAQQDAFLPYVENGTILLVGATTENPSFEINAALLSRVRVFVLHPLSVEEIVSILTQSLTDPDRGLGQLRVEVESAALRMLAEWSGGDARTALNTLELAVLATLPDGEGRRTLGREQLAQALQQAIALYDKAGEQHYNLISAFIKSIRDSNADATLYWLARMIEAGEDPMFIARRIVHHAAEDIGLADPQALVLASAAAHATHLIGLPEARLVLAEAAVYLARAPKSNRIYLGYEAAAADARATQAEPVPLHLRNAPTQLMKDLGYGTTYQYAHDFPGGVTTMECLPDRLRGRTYYAGEIVPSMAPRQTSAERGDPTVSGRVAKPEE